MTQSRFRAGKVLFNRGWCKLKVEAVGDEAGYVQLLRAVVADIDEIVDVSTNRAEAHHDAPKNAELCSI